MTLGKTQNISGLPFPHPKENHPVNFKHSCEGQCEVRRCPGPYNQLGFTLPRLAPCQNAWKVTLGFMPGG